MAKLVRNSLFTLVILILTAIGLSWNKKVVRQADPIQISNTVLSAASAEDKHDFPLKLEFTRRHVKLGQYQEMKIATLANAELQIVTIYPTGSINNPQTVRAVADETGHYSMKFKLDDFAFLGVFQTKVLARFNGRESQTSGRYALQTWTQSDKTLGADGYTYPIVP